ncbi:MAG: DUF1553 domain-containing protein [Planctomycetaceae bacterium]|nr:DUF1553 domain-containing protein [Planctomycetaceae bacterium]
MRYFFLLSLLTLARADALGGESGFVDFDTQIVPILTKSGCNTGACHGAAAGRGEFHLSLYGGDRAFDYHSIALELESRRVNLARPEQSLLLLKATESINHGGGPRLEYEGADMKTIQKWIEEGARRHKMRLLVDFKLEPRQRITQLNGEPILIRSIAQFSDGSTHDVTAWTVLTAEDPAAVQVNSQQNTVRVLRTGRHIVIARYLDRVVPMILLVPQKHDEIAIPDGVNRNLIDKHVNSLLETLRIPLSPQANDATFLRRATLDFTGRLPTLEQVVAFENDSRQNKREQLIDSLLNSEAFIDYWTYKFAKLLRIHPQGQDRTGAQAYHNWLRTQITQDTPYDEIAQTLLTATGDSHTVGPANFYRTVGGPREQAEFVSELFMGSRLRCANCHNHPLDRWTQDDYHGLSAIFAKLDRGRVVKVIENGTVIHLRTGEPAVPRIPGEQFLSDEGDSRAQFASWLTDAENPFFAKAIVNRLWKELMGRGLVEPTDDLRSTNPATHPTLLEQLAEEFVDRDYSLKHILRQIATSAAYARSASTRATNEHDDRFYSHAIIRPLEPEVLADAIADVTGVPITYGQEPRGTRAVNLFDPQTPSPELEILGRCSREDSCESKLSTTGDLPRMLHQFTGPLINSRITNSDGRLEKMLNKNQKPDQIIFEFYRVALSRSPSSDETQFWQKQLTAGRSLRERREILQDFVWSLCTCQEFITNH